jgi:hypothetical protein
MHANEAFYALDNPLKAAIFSVLVELMNELVTRCDIISNLIVRVPYGNMRTSPSSGLSNAKISFTRPDGKILEDKKAVAL